MQEVLSTCKISLLLQLLVEVGGDKAHVVPRSLLRILLYTQTTLPCGHVNFHSLPISILFFRSIDSDVPRYIDRSSGETGPEDGSPNRDTSRGGVLD